MCDASDMGMEDNCEVMCFSKRFYVFSCGLFAYFHSCDIMESWVWGASTIFFRDLVSSVVIISRGNK